MQVHNFDQYSPEWWNLRAKKLTASHAQAIGSQGPGLETYTTQLVADIYRKNKPEGYQSKYMEAGLEMEPEAALVYQAETLSDVQEVGFVVYSDYVGCSPDRLVDEDGLLEIKCLSDMMYFQLLITGKIESKYLWQMQMQMICTGRKWCDFFAYNPNYDRNFFLKKVLPDPKKVKKLKEGFVLGEKMIIEKERVYLQKEAS